MSVRRVLLGVIVVILVGLVAAVAYAWHGEIDPVEPAYHRDLATAREHGTQ